MNVIERSVDLNGKGQILTLQFGKLAQQATSSVLAKLGETTVLVTVMAGKETSLDYFPLNVEYVEKLYAGGRIKGSRWVKREGRPTDEAVLKGRLIDRSIRPLFPKQYKREVQIIITTLSVDSIYSSEIVGAIAVSAALHVSSIPFLLPISTIKVGYFKDDLGDGSLVVSPTEQELSKSLLELTVSSTKEKVLMLETKAHQIPESIIIEGIKEAKKTNSKIIDFIESLRSEFGAPKEIIPEISPEEAVYPILKEKFLDKLNELISGKAQKESQNFAGMKEFISSVAIASENTYDESLIAKAIDSLSKKMIREKTLETKVRIDGRGIDDIRHLSAETSLLPRVHGTGLFARGETQVLSIVTLGAPDMEQIVDSPEGETMKRYMHHYNMPPYTVGEVGRFGSPSRREIGHGALAEKAVEPVLPDQSVFPYAIRVVSEVMSSNGSTSMASTCGSILALMDAGVPIKAPVSGIAMGIMTRSDDDYVILTDIMGIEDFSGEMDFKIAGTRDGITAIQLDVKNKGLTEKMIDEIFVRGHRARMKLLDVMLACISEPRSELSKYAPKIIQLNAPQEKIGEIIGRGGESIRDLIAKTNTTINIDDNGVVTITGVDPDGMKEAKNTIESIIRGVNVGDQFEAKIKRIMQFGAFAEYLPGKEGLIHVKNMSTGFVKRPEDFVEIDQIVKVSVVEVDKMGRVNLKLLK